MGTGLSGRWMYHSFHNDTGLVGDDAKRALDMIFGEGIFSLNANGDTVSGNLDMGNGYVLDIDGIFRIGSEDLPCILEMTGRGRPGTTTAGWQYEYIAYRTARWPTAVNQTNVFVGTVLRALPHSGKPAGVTASFMLAATPAILSTNLAPATFKQDILPKFRAQDINCMGKQGIHLADSSWMCSPEGDATYPDHANARLVFSVLEQGQMPPDAPWSQQRLETYKNWISNGFQP